MNAKSLYYIFLLFLDEPNTDSYTVTAVVLEAGNNEDENEDSTSMMDEINSMTSDTIVYIPESLPVTTTITPVLPGPSKKEKQRRITNQDVLKLQAEVLQHQKEVLLLKKQKLELQICALKGY